MFRYVAWLMSTFQVNNFSMSCHTCSGCCAFFIANPHCFMANGDVEWMIGSTK
ncbi:hypothetical protein XF_2253 [Xylella fastidiosa 9a5c]|uniref:Uncharacterized protein n=1 Tax=Xylella fastidiosa (strain 9a5c) TaxID=160492 RepID=Q9PB91_XYLFA|nr:hypothetical protein XF_2253 [Xylella fastidiosa 9a5c]